MKNLTKQSYVTETTFKKEANWTRGEFKKVHTEFDKVYTEFGKVHQRIDTVELSLQKTQSDVEEIKLTMTTMKEDLGQAIIKNQTRIESVEKNMMTKDVGDKILSHLQDLAKKYENADVSARIHLNQVMNFRPRIEDHEQRLVALEKRPPAIDQQ